MMTDYELLELLTVVLAPASIEPPAAGIVSLHRAVDVRETIVRKPLRVRRRWVVPAVVACSVLGVSGGVIAATGPSLPRLARGLAHGVGLPVDSPHLLDARSHRNGLRLALAHHDITAIAAESAKLRDELGRLDTDERKQVGSDTDQLLQQADSRIDADNTEGEHQTPITPTTENESNTDDSVLQPSGNQPSVSQIPVPEDQGSPNSEDEPIASAVAVDQPSDPDPPSAPDLSPAAPLDADEQSPADTVPENPTNATPAPNVDPGQIDEP